MLLRSKIFVVFMLLVFNSVLHISCCATVSVIPPKLSAAVFCYVLIMYRITCIYSGTVWEVCVLPLCVCARCCEFEQLWLASVSYLHCFNMDASW
jgi:hypothetical protein